MQQQGIINFISRKINEVLDLISSQSNHRDYREMYINEQFELLNKKLDLLIDIQQIQATMMLNSDYVKEDEIEALGNWRAYAERLYRQRPDGVKDFSHEFMQYLRESQ